MLLLLLGCVQRSISGCPESAFDLGPDERVGEHATPAEFAAQWDGVQLSSATVLPPGLITVDGDMATASVVLHGSCGAADTVTYMAPATLEVDGTTLSGELFWDQRDLYGEVTLGVSGNGPDPTLAWLTELLETHRPGSGEVHSFASAWLMESREARFGLYWEGPDGSGETSWQEIPELVQPFEITE